MYNDFWVILQAFNFFHLPVTSYCFKKIVKTNWFFIICWIPLLYYILKDNTYIYMYIQSFCEFKKKKKYSIIITDSLYISCLLTMLWIFFMQFNFSKNKFYKFFSHKTDLISVKTIPFQKELQFFWKSINWSNYEYWKHNQWKKDTPHSPRKYTT